MIKKDKDAKKISLVLSPENEVAYFTSTPFTFYPEWASIDVERGELYFGGQGEDGEAVLLDSIKEEIYQTILKNRRILLAFLDAKDPIRGGQAFIVPLMVANQIER